MKSLLRIDLVRVAVAPGVIMDLDEHDYVDREILCRGGYEHSTVALFDRLIRNARGFTDIGAHHGLFSLRAARQLEAVGGRVAAFEPMPFNSVKLLRNARLSGLTNIDHYSIALSDNPGVVRMVQPRNNNSGGARLLTGSDAPQGCSIFVAVDTLQAIATQLPCGAFDVVKLDVEGQEGRVLRSVLSDPRFQRPRHIIAEYIPASFDYDTLGDFPSWLTDLGYHVRTVTGEKFREGMELPDNNIWAERRD